MKVAIFGATGATGRLVVEQALAEDHTVTAFARHREAVTAKHLRLSIIQGDVFQPADVQQAVEGQDAIICTIGGHDAFRGSSQTGQQGLCTIGTKHILDAMEQSNVARFICLSSWGVGDSKERIPFLFARIIFPLMMKEEFVDKEEQELVQGLITITHCFSSRLYGLRTYRKALEKALRDENRAQDPHEPDS